ncbi:hypothetical protein [Streptomyces sp. NPDC059786]|uniref:hypothetical protein n=1 Tax=Streptomyces sp. NPDC059786 TaxID=3346946 RepID=UPI0036471CBA
MPDDRIPTDDEIQRAAWLLVDGGFNDVDPEKARYATELVEGAGEHRSRVVALILDRAAELANSRNL